MTDNTILLLIRDHIGLKTSTIICDNKKVGIEPYINFRLPRQTTVHKQNVR